MVYVLISLALIVIYFVIAAIKEGQANETIERERKENLKKISNIHFENLVNQELMRQKMLDETRKVFAQRLEKEEGILKVTFEDNKIIIVPEYDLNAIEAKKEAKVWISTLMPSLEIDVVELQNIDGIIFGTANRSELEGSPENKPMTNSIESDENVNQNNMINKEFQETNYKFSSMFYSFCFSNETAKIFLEESETRNQISSGLMASIVEEKNIIEKLFKIFLKKKYDFNLGESSYGKFTVNGYEFYIDKLTIRVSEINTFFEVFYNEFEDVVDSSGDKMAIAREFILFVKEFQPTAIFVLVYDPLIEKYAVRRVFENGSSIKLTFLDNNDGSECIDFLKDYVKKNFF